MNSGGQSKDSPLHLHLDCHLDHTISGGRRKDLHLDLMIGGGQSKVHTLAPHREHMISGDQTKAPLSLDLETVGEQDHHHHHHRHLQKCGSMAPHLACGMHPPSPHLWEGRGTAQALLLLVSPQITAGTTLHHHPQYLMCRTLTSLQA